MDRGYIRLWRKIKDCKALRERGKRYSKLEAWIHLVAFEAQGVERNGLRRGEFEASIRYLAKAWRWSNDSVFRFLRALESEKMIARAERLAERYPEHLAERFTICNYELYNPTSNTNPNATPNAEPNKSNKVLNKEKEVKETHAAAAAQVTPKKLFEIYQQNNQALPEVQELSPERLNKCRSRINRAVRDGRLEQYLEDFEKAVKKAQSTPFLRGEGARKWRASFDWLIANNTNIYGVLEGKYDGAASGVTRDTVGQSQVQGEMTPEYLEELRRARPELFEGLE